MTLRKAALPLSTSAEEVYDGDDDPPLYVYVEDIPEVITPLLMAAGKRKGEGAVTVATGSTVQDAIFHLRSFLPGAESGHFSLQEVAAILKFHLQGTLLVDEDINNDQDNVAMKTLKSRLHDSVCREGASDSEDKDDTSMFWRFREKTVAHPERYTATGNLLQGVDDAKPVRNRYPTSTASSSRRNVYFLPTRGNLHDRKSQRSRNSPYTVSEAEVDREFAKLDLSGEGKLTFLTVKSALELMNSSGTSTNEDMDDVVIRSWLRDHDRGAKGYVDRSDFLRIFASVISTSHDESGYSTSHQGSRGKIDDNFASIRERDDKIVRLKA